MSGPLPILDALIVGGGPAGAAAAIVLARAGLNTVVLERTRLESERIGECLPPEVCAPLIRLGVWPRFVGQGHRPSPGILSCWGASEPRVTDFLCNPYGGGWHVDRVGLNRLLLQVATESGAEVHLGTTVKSLGREHDGHWRAEAEHERRPLCMRARQVICATGRARGPSRPGSGRLRADRLVGYVAVLRADDAADDGDARLLLEAVEDGWWYSARLPGRAIVVGYLTDPDLWRGPPSDLHEAYWRRLRETHLTRRWLEMAAPEGCVRSYAADTSWWPAAAWEPLSVGDAAAGLDPLAGHGVVNALLSGERAALAVIATANGDRCAVAEYVAKQRRARHEYLRCRTAHYRAEQRWPESPFWRRRHLPQERVIGT